MNPRTPCQRKCGNVLPARADNNAKRLLTKIGWRWAKCLIPLCGIANFKIIVIKNWGLGTFFMIEIETKVTSISLLILFEANNRMIVIDIVN